MIVTGGSGLLGTELQKHLDAWYPSRQEMDVTNRTQVWDQITSKCPRVVLHLAAWTDVAGAEDHRDRCWQTNVQGTQNVVEACRWLGAGLIFISTDYVFDGQTGGYNPTDTPNPVNYYALTKLAGECVVRTWRPSLIIRTSFKSTKFPHPQAFDDMYTSADYVDIIVPMIVEIIDQGYTGIYHLGTGRKSVYDLVSRRNPDVSPMSLSSWTGSLTLPQDVSFGPVSCVDWDGAEHVSP